MKRQDFDNYRFSIGTLVKIRGKWSKLTEVFFHEGLIGIEGSRDLVNYREIRDIKENPLQLKAVQPKKK